MPPQDNQLELASGPPSLLGDYLGRVASGQVAMEGLTGLGAPGPNPLTAGLAAAALDPAGLERATNLALGFAGGGMTKPAWHGTPHTFEPEPGAPFGAFRNEAIGSGEGAQAYGWGHYVAGNPKVAESYKEGDKGSLLEVHVLPEEHELLDWDKPLSAQKELMAKTSPELKQFIEKRWGSDDPTGEQLYRTVSNSDLNLRYSERNKIPWGFGDSRNDEAASKLLHEAGVPGIKYLDAGSRGPAYTVQAKLGNNDWFDYHQYHTQAEASAAAEARKAADSGIVENSQYRVVETPRTSNYVIFDPSNLRIIGRNGERLEPVDHDPFGETK